MTSHLWLYFGVPLTGRSPKAGDYQHLIDKVKVKLILWKARQLPMAGRATLAKVVIEALPTL